MQEGAATARGRGGLAFTSGMGLLEVGPRESGGEAQLGHLRQNTPRRALRSGAFR